MQLRDVPRSYHDRLAKAAEMRGMPMKQFLLMAAEKEMDRMGIPPEDFTGAEEGERNEEGGDRN